MKPKQFVKEGLVAVIAMDEGQVENLIKSGWTENTLFVPGKPAKRAKKAKKKVAKKKKR